MSPDPDRKNWPYFVKCDQCGVFLKMPGWSKVIPDLAHAGIDGENAVGAAAFGTIDQAIRIGQAEGWQMRRNVARCPNCQAS